MINRTKDNKANDKQGIYIRKDKMLEYQTPTFYNNFY